MIKISIVEMVAHLVQLIDSMFVQEAPQFVKISVEMVYLMLQPDNFVMMETKTTLMDVPMIVGSIKVGSVLAIIKHVNLSVEMVS